MSNILLSAKKVHDADKEDANRWDALPFHSEDYFSYKDLAKQFKGHKSGRHIAIVMLKNAKRKGAIALAPIREI